MKCRSGERCPGHSGRYGRVCCPTTVLTACVVSTSVPASTRLTAASSSQVSERKLVSTGCAGGSRDDLPRRRGSAVARGTRGRSAPSGIWIRGCSSRSRWRNRPGRRDSSSARAGTVDSNLTTCYTMSPMSQCRSGRLSRLRHPTERRKVASIPTPWQYASTCVLSRTKPSAFLHTWMRTAVFSRGLSDGKYLISRTRDRGWHALDWATRFGSAAISVSGKSMRIPRVGVSR